MKRIVCVVSLVLTASLAVAQQRKAPAAAPAPTLDQGVQQVEEGDFEAAVKTLEKVLDTLPNDAAHAQDRGHALLYMAIAYLGLSEEANAKARFVDALKQDKDLKLNPRQFSPKVLALFEQAKREAGGRAAPGAPAAGTSASAHSALFFLAVKNGDFAAVTQMLKEDPRLANERDSEFGATPLHWAALRGQEVVAGALLAQGADPTLTNRDGETALKVAQRAGREGMVRLLRSQENQIFVAIKAGDVNTVREMLDKDPTLIARRDAEFGATPLHWAALKGYESIVGLLLARGADPTAVNSAGETPLTVAERGGKTGAVQLLRPSGVNLFEAVKAGDVAGARTILDRDPSLVNRPDAAFSATPLHWAALKGHVDMVNYLLSVGADQSLKNSKDETALDVARRSGRAEIVAALTNAASGGAPAPVPAAGAAGAEEDIFAAAKAGDVVAVRRILERNPALLNEPDAQFGGTPLHWAAARGHVDLVSFLLAAGADTGARNKAGETPLQVAQRANRAEVIAALSGLSETSK
jgi:ankyrin repeat protein